MQQQEAQKYDGEKLRMDLVPPEAIEAMAAVLTDGAARYGARNWETGTRWGRFYAALQRHILAWWQGEDLDPDSGRPHLWHALCCVAFLATYEQRGVGEDDRPAAPTSPAPDIFRLQRITTCSRCLHVGAVYDNVGLCTTCDREAGA